MEKKIDYKKRNTFLAVGVPILLLIIYSLTIKKTMALRRECSRIEKELEQIQYAPTRIQQTEKRLSELSAVINSSASPGTDAHEIILEKCTQYTTKNNIILRDYPMAQTNITNNFLIETNKLIIEGSFIPLLRLLYLYEQEYKVGRVVSASFVKQLDRQTKQNRLLATYYIQNIKISTHESK